MYSPSGCYLAFKDAQDGQPRILDLATGERHGLYDLIGWDRPNLQCVEFVWLSDERLCMCELWMTEYMRTAWRWRYRVIDWVARATVFERDISTQELSEFNLLGGYSEDSWIVSRRPSDPDWHWWVYDPVQQEFVKPLVPRLRKGDWIPYGPQGPWAVKWLLPCPTTPGENDWQWNVPYDVEFVNCETGETRHLSQVPCQFVWGPFITADGRYAVKSFEVGPRSVPVVFDTLTGQRHELPSTESWRAVAISHARAVVAALVPNKMPDETWTAELVEIPLSRLLPQ